MYHGGRGVDVSKALGSITNAMRSITFHSGAIWEFVEALHLNMAVLTIPPQYGYVLITLILSILT